MDEHMLRIGEVAAFFGVSVKALRVYERIGILRPARVDPRTGYRLYAPDQVRHLDAILELRELGFSLAEIKGLLQSELSPQGYMELLTHKKLAWQEQMDQAQARIDAIEEIIDRLAHAQPPVKLHALTEEERAALLNRMAALDVNLHELHARSVLSEALWL